MKAVPQSGRWQTCSRVPSPSSMMWASPAAVRASTREVRPVLTDA